MIYYFIIVFPFFVPSSKLITHNICANTLMISFASVHTLKVAK